MPFFPFAHFYLPQEITEKEKERKAQWPCVECGWVEYGLGDAGWGDASPAMPAKIFMPITGKEYWCRRREAGKQASGEGLRAVGGSVRPFDGAVVVKHFCFFFVQELIMVLKRYDFMSFNNVTPQAKSSKKEDKNEVVCHSRPFFTFYTYHFIISVEASFHYLETQETSARAKTSQFHR